jgi:predicted MFS family arabinose efflux permease
MIDRTIIVVVLGTTAAQVATAMGIAIFPVIAPQLAARLEIDASFVGYQMSLLFGAAMVASPLAGTAVLRWGACRSMQVAMGACIAGMGLAIAGNLVLLAASAVLLGVCAALVAAGAAHLLFRFGPPEHHNLIFSIKQTGVPLGWAAIALVAPAITLNLGWRASLAAVLAYSVCMLIALQWVRARWDDDRKRQGAQQGRFFSGVGVVWRYPVLRRLALASFFFSFVQLCVGTFTVTLLVTEAGYSLVGAGAMLSLVMIAGMFGRVALGWIADATGRTSQVLALSDLIVAACCIATVFVSAAWPPGLLAALYFVFGAMSFGWNGVLQAQVARLSPQGMVSVTMGGVMVWIFAGTFLGPALFASGYRFVGSYTATFGVVALAALAGWAALRSMQRAERAESMR